MHFKLAFFVSVVCQCLNLWALGVINVKLAPLGGLNLTGFHRSRLTKNLKV